ncbi:MAG TPA: anthranilate phosphoribosyltransferase [Allosphingosinicella sp.]|jgi:anthranilate phosphoribosyltransferase|uniref:anthranilate phosphoribosyltransferase n=1 Tax=Allosphingosinicella sp. TaxID=2823234 RepID=UPI002F2987A7
MPRIDNLARLPLPEPSFEAEAAAAIARLFCGEHLGREESEILFGELVAGRLSEPQIAGMLIALRLKGETSDEMIGAAKSLRAADAPFPRPNYLFADTCGTGGDGSSLINVSTAVAFVAAAAGLPVAKHGNRSVTSPCGSADVLERLGVRLDCSAEVSRRALDETGICFLLAPLYHPGLRHAGPVRRALKVRTIMNLLGPCLNPAEPEVQLLGVAEARHLEPVARTLASLGVRNALVVHGSGIDEMALHGETRAVRISGDRFETLTIAPEDAGLQRRPLASLKGGGPEENAERMKALLMGHGQAAEVDSVALNAGALLFAARLAPELREGVAQARDVIASGEPYRRLRLFVEATND